MLSRQESRRQVLRLASALLAVPFATLGSSEVQAAARPPLRLLTFIDSYGLPTENRSTTWLTNSTVGDYALVDGDLGGVLAPLRAYRDRILLVSGMSLTSLRQAREAGTHDQITGQALTGSASLGGGNQGAAAKKTHSSVDVHIGEYLNESYGLAKPRVYPHLHLSDYAETDKTTFCFDARGNQIRAIAGPHTQASALFAGTGDTTSLSLDNQTHRLALELVRERLVGIRSELVNANAGTVLDAYQASVEGLATELELRSGAVCSAPDVSQAPADGGRNAAHMPFTLQNIFQAFACDLASSITYSPGGENIDQFTYDFLYDPSYGESVRALLSNNLHAASHITTADAQRTHEVVRSYQIGELARLIDQLSASVDVDGSTLLDNTVVFISSAMAHNTHSADDYAYALIAGKNTNLKGGMHYDCSTATHNDLLTTIAQGLTLPDVSFGGFDKAGAPMEDANHGPITKMLRS